MKMTKSTPTIINIFIDGTWQKDDQEIPTNISKLYQAARDCNTEGVEQHNVYIDGLGTRGTSLQNLFRGAFGTDIEDLVKEAYKEVVTAYEPGDSINLLGYSRGATVTRMLAGMIDNVGILNVGKLRHSNVDKIIDKGWRLYRKIGEYEDQDTHPSHKVASQFRRLFCHADENGTHDSSPNIDHMVLFDTVGALGVPDKFFISNLFNRHFYPSLNSNYYRFYNNTVPELVNNVIHFIAMDEARDTYELTPIENNPANRTKIQNIYVRGDHGVVGGGSEDHQGLSDHVGIMAITHISDIIEFCPVKIEELFNPDPFGSPYTTDEFYNWQSSSDGPLQKMLHSLASIFHDKVLRDPPSGLRDGDPTPQTIYARVDEHSLEAVYTHNGIAPESFDIDPALKRELWKTFMSPKLREKQTPFQGFNPAELQRNC